MSAIPMVFWNSLLETAPYLMAGLFCAGLLHVLVPPRIILWALGGSGFSGAARGAALGLPLPLCSCGVIPTAMALRRQGASISATTAFTVSTPETSIDALSVTAALLPGAFLLVRPLSSIALAVLVGMASEWLARDTAKELRASVLEFAHGAHQGVEAVCRVCGLRNRDESSHQHGLASRALAVLRYAYGTFFNDIAFWLIFGLLMAALIQTYLPGEWLASAWVRSHHWAQIGGAMLLGIPLYSCATATTPLVAALMAKGLSPGAALAFLLSAPATNPATILVLKRELGGRVACAYYVSLLLFCALLGLGFDALWPSFAAAGKFAFLFKMPAQAGGHVHGKGGVQGLWRVAELLSAVLLSLLALRVLGLRFWSFLSSRSKSAHEGLHAGHDHDCCE